jgi:hypothetical protein
VKPVAQGLAEVQGKIAAACARSGRDPSTVKLIAVSKKQPLERLAAAVAAGQLRFGENYVQELEAHRERFRGSDLEWHLIGHLQTNKAKKAAALASMIHTVDSTKLARALGAAAAEHSTPLPVLVEVNLAGESSKSGCSPADAEVVLEAIAEQTQLVAAGLMTMPPPDQPARPWFQRLRLLRDRLQLSLGRPLPELSMGMSHDFEEAIEEGATLVRVGTAIFGPRE